MFTELANGTCTIKQPYTVAWEKRQCSFGLEKVICRTSKLLITAWTKSRKQKFQQFCTDWSFLL